MKEVKMVAVELLMKCPCWLKEDKEIRIVKITGECTAVEVDVLLYNIFGHSEIPMSDDAEGSLMALCEAMEEQNVGMPGGLMFSEGNVEVTPSCCCELEQWRESVRDINAKQSPWMGHDPWGNCRFEGDKIIVCEYDPEMDDVPEEEIGKITFTEAEMKGYFENLEKEAQEFINGPLRKRIEELAPQITDRFIKAWDHNFNRIFE